MINVEVLPYFELGSSSSSSRDTRARVSTSKRSKCPKTFRMSSLLKSNEHRLNHFQNGMLHQKFDTSLIQLYKKIPCGCIQGRNVKPEQATDMDSEPMFSSIADYVIFAGFLSTVSDHKTWSRYIRSGVHFEIYAITIPTESTPKHEHYCLQRIKQIIQV